LFIIIVPVLAAAVTFFGNEVVDFGVSTCLFVHGFKQNDCVCIYYHLSRKWLIPVMTCSRD